MQRERPMIARGRDITAPDARVLRNEGRSVPSVPAGAAARAVSRAAS